MSRIFRVWMHLAALRRRGQVHDIDNILQGRRKNSLAIRCPACPEIHVNVDAETIKKAREDEAYVTKSEIHGFHLICSPSKAQVYSFYFSRR
jgi:hypothetical protein